ncbi:MAG: hypothetical protein EHM89_00195 [Acidobacteria bacterium]|nr:MAG: hypothetical protein EHM89_00195 [Acidobacteriota bacterium]
MWLFAVNCRSVTSPTSLISPATNEPPPADSRFVVVPASVKLPEAKPFTTADDAVTLTHEPLSFSSY